MSYDIIKGMDFDEKPFRLWTLREVAEATGFTVQALQRMIDQGALRTSPVVKDRIPNDEVREMVEGRAPRGHKSDGWHVLSEIIEIWIHDWTCNDLHSEFDASRILGIAQFRMVELGGLGLRPVEEDTRGNRLYRCEDVREFAYGCEAAVGIDYQQWRDVGRRLRGYDQFVRVHKRNAPQKHLYAENRQRALLDQQSEPPPRAVRPPVAPPVAVPGFVYLFHWNGLHKIGMTVNVASRIAGLTTLPNVTIDLVHSVATVDMRASEKFLHRKFSSCRVQGEWFSLPQDAITWICALKDGDLDGLRKTVDLERAS